MYIFYRISGSYDSFEDGDYVFVFSVLISGGRLSVGFVVVFYSIDFLVFRVLLFVIWNYGFLVVWGK